MNQIILPSLHCYRLKHRIDSRAKSPGPGRYDYCVVCTLGWEMARTQLGDDHLADEFVNELRAS